MVHIYAGAYIYFLIMSLFQLISTISKWKLSDYEIMKSLWWGNYLC